MSQHVGSRQPDRKSLLSNLTASDEGADLPGECSRRWHECLNPNISNARWTLFEDELLAEAVEHYGRKWTEIVERYFPNRRPIAAKNRQVYTEHALPLHRLDQILNPRTSTVFHPPILIPIFTRYKQRWENHCHLSNPKPPSLSTSQPQASLLHSAPDYSQLDISYLLSPGKYTQLFSTPSLTSSSSHTLEQQHWLDPIPDKSMCPTTPLPYPTPQSDASAMDLCALPAESIDRPLRQTHMLPSSMDVIIGPIPNQLDAFPGTAIAMQDDSSPQAMATYIPPFETDDGIVALEQMPHGGLSRPGYG